MTLSSYLVSIVLVASVSAIMGALAPEGSTKKYLSLLLSVAVLAVLLSPLPDLSLSFDGLTPDKTPVPDGEPILLDATEQALLAALCTELSIPQSDAALSISGACDEAGGVTLERVTLTLSGDSTARREAARAFLESNLPNDCEVSVYVQPYHK